MNDIECPYCGAEQEINHDDGYGYEEDQIFQQECSECEKSYAYTTAIILHHTATKAECLNDGNHKYAQTHTFPKEFTEMECPDCGTRRKLTDAELKMVMSSE